MALMDFIKKHVVDTGDENAQAAPAAPPPAAVQPPKGNPQWATASTVKAQVMDNEMLSQLNAAINGRKTAYISLLEKSEQLREFIPDETTRLKAAYKSLDGRSFNDIATAIAMHVSDIEGLRTRFKATSDAQVATRVGQLRSESSMLINKVSSNTKRLEEIRAEAVRLETENQEASARAGTLQAEAEAAEAEIRAVEQRFNASVDYVVADLGNKKANLATVLN